MFTPHPRQWSAHSIGLEDLNRLALEAPSEVKRPTNSPTSSGEIAVSC
jgi:hypothetical protein